MIKLIFLCRRRPELTAAEYAERLLQGHVPLALRHHPTLRRYVVNIVENCPPGAPPLDSIGELWFDTLADFRERLYDSPAGAAIIQRDVAGFLAAADAYATTEHVHRAEPTPAIGRRTPGTKLFCPVRRAASLTGAEFTAHWLERHVPLALAHHPQLTGYVTNVVDQQLSASGDAWDGFAELSFAPTADGSPPGVFASADAERAIRDDMARFIGHTLAYRVGEYVQRW